MINIKNICIIGAGNIGVAAAAAISQNNQFNVTLLSSRAKDLSCPLKKIDTDSNTEILGNNIFLTDDYQDALKNCDLVIVTVPSFLIKNVIEQVSDFSIKMILFLPGYGGKEFFCNELQKKGCIIAGLDRAPYVARLSDSYTVKASKKKQIRLAVLKHEVSNELCKFVELLFGIPCTPIHNYLNVSFTPSNPILHTSRLYSMFKDASISTVFPRMIKFYAEWNDDSSSLLFKMDEELMQICKAFPKINLTDVIPNSVHYDSSTPELLTKKMRSISSLKNIDSPMKLMNNFYVIDLESRYFKEDFMFGLCNLKGFAVIANIQTPYMDNVLKWYEHLSGEQFFTEDNRFFCNPSTGCPQNFGLFSVEDIYNFYSA
jgi:hypothetical protein